MTNVWVITRVELLEDFEDPSGISEVDSVIAVVSGDEEEIVDMCDRLAEDYDPIVNMAESVRFGYSEFTVVPAESLPNDDDE